MATYPVKRRLVSVGRDSDVLDERGATVFTIDGTVRFARRFEVKDRDVRMHVQWTHRGDEANITRAGSRIAGVSRQQNTVVAEIFHLWTADAEDPALLLAIAMVIVEGDQSRGQAS